MRNATCDIIEGEAYCVPLHADADTDAYLEMESEAVREPDPEAEVEIDSELEVEDELESNVELEPEQDAEHEPDGELEQEPEVDAEAAVEHEADAGADMDTDTEAYHPSTNIDWVSLPGGSFMMGSDDGDADEQPVHQVSLPGFEIARTEVTVAQYRKCVDAGVCTAPNTGTYCNWDVTGRDAHPVNCVDWYQARAFSEWVGGRLPSEAEWEYAARSCGEDRKYPWGDEDATCDHAVMNEGGYGCGQDSTGAACSIPAGNTHQGICDMAGNVYEWVEDDRHDGYTGAPDDGGAWMDDPRASLRICRGGSWFDVSRFLLVSDRSTSVPSHRYDDIGFRPARDLGALAAQCPS